MRKLIFVVLVLSIAFQSCKKASTPKVYIITASSGPNGSIDPAGKITVNAGSNATYTISPAANYNIATFTVDDVAVPAGLGNNTYTFTNVQANHTISATFGQNIQINIVSSQDGTVTPSSPQVRYGGSVTLTFSPHFGYLTDILYINGVLTASLNGATTYALNNLTADVSIRVSFAITPKGLDSLSNLLISQWTMVALNGKLGNLQNMALPWDTQSLAACSSNQFDQFYAYGVFQRNNNPAACDPLAYPNQQQFVPRPLDHWKLKTNGKVIYLTDAPLDSLTNITVTKDSLIAFYYGGFTSVQGISYWYHYARKH